LLAVDGGRINIEAVSAPVEVGGTTRTVGLIRDVTRRKQYEAQIRDQAALLEKAQDAILVLDLDGTVKFWNPSAGRLYGWTPEEAVGRSFAELLFPLGDAQFGIVRSATLDAGEWQGELEQIASDARKV